MFGVIDGGEILEDQMRNVPESERIVPALCRIDRTGHFVQSDVQRASVLRPIPRQSTLSSENTTDYKTQKCETPHNVHHS